MKGDFTRSTFDQKKHYSSVRMQQGRVQLDADWNEQADIQRYMRKQNMNDIVGKCGAPLHNAGFALSGKGNILKIGKGHFYVHGILCENETEVDFETEEELQTNRNYLFYLDVWEQHITAVEDPGIREVALGGPDTTTRTKTVWKVKCIEIDEKLPEDEDPCIQEYAKWNELTAKRTARLKAFVESAESPPTPCVVPPGAGYTGLENHLYRVEIHEGSQEDGVPTFKWSRDNGSVVRAIRAIKSIDVEHNVITIIEPGQDVLHAFAPEQWVEITDDERELNQEPGTLVRLKSVSNGVSLTFYPETIIGDPINDTKYPIKQNPKVRRWESKNIDIGDSELEHGLKVQFNLEDDYRSGDYWLIPARTSSGNIEWDENNAGWVERFGVEHHYCRLAVLFQDNSGNWSLVKDCRKLFPPATEMVTLLYVGGDGQEAMPGEELSSPLKVMVTAGQHPVEDARVQFVIKGPGTLIPDGIIKTGVDGIAQCKVQFNAVISETNANLQIDARLLDAVLFDDSGDVITEAGTAIHPSIRFNINASIASSVSYTPECSYLNSLEVSTVQAAIDALCDYKEPGIHIKAIYKTGQDGDTDPLVNDSEISVTDLASGIQVICDEKIAPETVIRKPTCFVTLYMPFPFNYADQQLWGNSVIGSQPLILASEVHTKGNVIYWNPSEATRSWLQEPLFGMMRELKRDESILCHLTLKGNFIWAMKDSSMYLDGEAFGVSKNEAESNLVLPSGNGRRGGDFEMWFWLVGGIRYVEYNVPENLLVKNGLCEDDEKICEQQDGVSGGRFYAMVGSRVALNRNSDALLDLLIDEGVNDRLTIAVGDSLILPMGFTFTPEQIDIEGEKALFSLSKNGNVITSMVVHVGELCTHTEKDIMGETDVPVFVIFLRSVFKGMDTNLVQMSSTWLVDF